MRDLSNQLDMLHSYGLLLHMFHNLGSYSDLNGQCVLCTTKIEGLTVTGYYCCVTAEKKVCSKEPNRSGLLATRLPFLQLRLTGLSLSTTKQRNSHFDSVCLFVWVSFRNQRAYADNLMDTSDWLFVFIANSLEKGGK